MIYITKRLFKELRSMDRLDVIESGCRVTYKYKGYQIAIVIDSHSGIDSAEQLDTAVDND